MTSSGRARKPAGGRPVGAGTRPGAAQSAGTTADDTQGRGPLGDGPTAAPDDAGQLQQEIERTREQLGQTVEQLAAKADVKGRARAKAVEVSERVKTRTGQAQSDVAAGAESVRSQLAAKAAAARQKAASASGAGKSRLDAVGTPMWEATPEPLRRSVARGASIARQHRVPLAAAAGVLIAGYLAIRWWRKR